MGFIGDFFDALLNKTCSVVELSEGAADAYGEPTETHTVLASNIPCAIAADAIGRAEEYRSEKQVARNFRRVFMRPPTLSNGKKVNQNYYLLLDGVYCDIIDVINPGGRDHHIEVMIENFVGS